MKIAMVGTGYVGLVSGLCFAEFGFETLCVDKDQNRLNNISKGICPFFEPGLQELVVKNYFSGSLKFTTDLSMAVKDSSIIFICVGTPI